MQEHNIQFTKLFKMRTNLQQCDVGRDIKINKLPFTSTKLLKKSKPTFIGFNIIIE